MSANTWTFDVALSFAGEDREQAKAIAEALREHELTVYFDEWFQADTVGKNLAIILRDIYLRARFCIPIVSKNYVSSPFPQHEWRVLLERDVLTNDGSILPVRLDDAVLEGLNQATAFLDYRRDGAARIASVIAIRVKNSVPAQPATGNIGLQIGIAEAPLPSKYMLSTHSRRLPNELYSIDAPNLIEMALSADQSATASMRCRLAREFLIYLNWKRDSKLGVAYGLWREGNKVFLSTLPSFSAPQRTLEFTFNASNQELHLESEWTTSDPRYAALHFSEWQPAVKGLTADRSDLYLDREVTILIMEKKGAEFGFPIVPAGNTAEKLCGWLNQDPPTDYLDWSRDPRLIDGNVGVWTACYHRPTGIGMLNFVLQGRWSSAAFAAVSEALRTLLPTRHRLKIVSHGAVRVNVFLIAAPDLRRMNPSGYPSESAHFDIGVYRTYAALARMMAAHRQLPVPAPSRSDALPPLSDGQSSLFKEAVDELGDSEYPDMVDGADLGFSAAAWIKLRQADCAGGRDPWRFDYKNTVTLQEICDYLVELERSD